MARGPKQLRRLRDPRELVWTEAGPKRRRSSASIIVLIVYLASVVLHHPLNCWSDTMDDKSILLPNRPKTGKQQTIFPKIQIAVEIEKEYSCCSDGGV
jgi:hypothetical protein